MATLSRKPKLLSSLHETLRTGHIIAHTARHELRLERSRLLTAEPLFPVAGKFNYARSTVHFLAYIQQEPALQLLLQHVCSVNLTREGQYLAFDEALEYFGVHFVKQNISGNPINEENLMLQIQAVQGERDRIDLLLSEFLGDHVAAQGKHT